jgi:hypothetical protein
MTPRATVLFAAIGAAVLAAGPSAALGQTAAATAAGNADTEFSSQARARTRIRVTPGYPYRTYSTDYPVQYKYEYPGPGYVRECSSWLAPENRLSGPVIVPKMRCWWQPGG